MNYRLFQYALPAPPDLEDLNAFLRSNRIASTSHHIVQTGTGALLVFLVQTTDSSVVRSEDRGQSKIDYREHLSVEEFAVFSRLRTERKKWAETEGVPVYTVFTNAQLAEMVKRRVHTMAELADIDGMGTARIEKYGERLLAVLANIAPRSVHPESMS